jgi:feruloyl-CoA synthase
MAGAAPVQVATRGETMSVSSLAPSRSATEAPQRPVRLGTFSAKLEQRPDGALLIRSTAELDPYPIKLSERLEHWARTAPERAFLMERGASGAWRAITYAEVLREVRRIGAALPERELSPDRPVAILSGNTINHALLGLAAMYVGVPYAPISPAYSLMSSDFSKLRSIIDLITPGLVFTNDGAPFARAIEAVLPRDVELLVAQNPPPNRPVTLFADIRAEADARVDAAHAAVGPDTIAKFLFTSGSTGTPKAVISTHRMLCSNQAMLTAAYRFLEDEPPVIVDWLPWNHTFGGSHNFNMVLTHGGTIYIDDGNPTPLGVGRTVRNLREIAPTIYYNVPKGYDALVPHLRADKQLRETFFSRLKVLCYAGANLSQPTWDALRALSIEACGERVVFLSSIGSTETSPLALCCTFDFNHPGNIGLPAPGVELKLVPTEGKLAARLRGPNITPGYWRQDHLTREAFDHEGFYKLGDALKWADPNDPAQGLLFDGRLAEDFKLASGTWVGVGPLRARFIDHFAPYVRDVVFAGADCDEITALVFPEIEPCRSLCADAPPDAKPAAILADARVERHFAALLTKLAALSPGTSTRVCRLLLLSDPPSIDAGEMTDKGSINQRAVLKRRAALVDELYRQPPSRYVIAIEEGT